MVKIELEEWQVKNLREYFGHNDKTQTEHWAYDVFNKAYKEQCTIPFSVIHWVACKDKMPNNTNRILTWDGQFVQEGHYTFIDRKIVVPSFKFHNEITHWAKLPEPPCV